MKIIGLNLQLHIDVDFFLERQFRDFYVDYFLKTISDKKTIYSKCACYKNDFIVGYVDNAIYFNNEIIFVEVKLSAETEKNIVDQLEKYCNVDKVILDNKSKKVLVSGFNKRNVIVIDIYEIYVFYQGATKLIKIFNLDELISLEGIKCIKSSIERAILLNHQI
jgi:hypothetical protein